MKILISNSSSEPIYEQIASQIKSLILRNELKEGEILPSIRSLAKELGISVITTKRAYEELEKEGFTETVRGKGTFVAVQNKEFMKENKLKIIEEKLLESVNEGKMLGLQLEDLIKMLKILYEN